MSIQTRQPDSPHVGKERRIPLRRRSKDARVALVDDDQYAARLEVSLDGTTWRYGVDDDRRVTFLDARDTDGRHVEVGEPDWMYDVFNQIGVLDR